MQIIPIESFSMKTFSGPAGEEMVPMKYADNSLKETSHEIIRFENMALFSKDGTQATKSDIVSAEQAREILIKYAQKLSKHTVTCELILCGDTAAGFAFKQGDKQKLIVFKKVYQSKTTY
jgi:hypothetical protein